MCGINAMSLQFLKNIFMSYDLYLIALICNLLVYSISKLQLKIYLHYLLYFVMKWCVSESILFNAFCLDIRQCNSHMKTEKMV